MAGLLNIGTSSLLLAQKQLKTVGHNITNVNTEGYSRQRVEQETNIPEFLGSGVIGTGAHSATTARMFDQFVTNQLRSATSGYNQFDTYLSFAKQVDGLLADESTGLSPSMQQFFDSLQGVTDDPSSLPAREVLINDSNALVERFQNLYSRLDELQGGANLEISGTVDELNGFSKAVADLNAEILKTEVLSSGQPVNDLRDRRDELVRKISEKVNVTVIEQDSGSLNVFMGNGQALVVDSYATQLAAQKDTLGTQQLKVAIQSPTGVAIDITKDIKGGSLGGTLNFVSEVLQPAKNYLGLTAIGLAQTFNEQHRLGLDLNDNLGQNYFNESAISFNSDSENKGTGSISAVYTVNGLADIQPSDYTLRSVDGGANYVLTRQSDNLQTNITAGGSPFTLSVDGMDITINAGAVAGDEFLIQPVNYAAREIDLLVKDASEVAAAGAARSFIDNNNFGQGEITPPILIADTTDPNYLAPTDPNYLQPFNIVFTVSGAGVAPVADQYSINGGAVQPYTSGTDIDFNGVRVQISKEVYSGDSFRVERNNGGVSDSRNALALSRLQSTKLLMSNDADYQSLYAKGISLVGGRTHSADINYEAQRVVLDETSAKREEVSGVNLDEEAAKLLSFQQVYQASAQIITASNTIFQSLLNAVQ